MSGEQGNSELPVALGCDQVLEEVVQPLREDKRHHRKKGLSPGV